MLHRAVIAIVLTLAVLAPLGQDAEAQPFAYVTNMQGNTVSVIDTATNAVVKTIPVGAYPVSVTPFVERVPTDTTPPSITPAIAGSVGNDGWYVSDVSIEWTVTDAESEVTSTTGCVQTTLGADTNGTTLAGAATSAGGTASASVTVKRDATPPSVTIASPADGATYAVRAAAAANWSASDATSGIATVEATSERGAALDTATPGSKSYTVTATDAAGNRRAVTHTYTVQSPAQMAQSLAAQVARLGLPTGTAHALLAKLDAAAAAWARGQVNAAASQVGAFVNQVDALAGTKIGAADAAGLVSAPQALVAAILGG